MNATAPVVTAPASGVTVVIPVYDEEEAIGELLTETFAALAPMRDFEVVVVDDGSADDTPAVLAQARRQHGERLRVLRHRVRSGQSAAMRTGIAAATYPWIATLDGDGQNDPADIPPLLAALQQSTNHEVAMVCGHRRRRRDNWLKRTSSRIANGVRRRLLRDDTLDTGCGLKVFRRDLFQRLPWFDHMHRFLPALARREGARVVSMDVRHRPRTRGRSKYGVHNRLWVGIVDMIGVMWLQRRGKVVVSDEMENR
ncbi:MAG: Dodecaprenyl-phosphate galacturonate synthase [Gammaproteobacteria bacterium]|nr:Dodecaprenyl-phosphate galacturonate synthase [Gammaproteobacteria bacterium]